jgi:hypothetical protein
MKATTAALYLTLLAVAVLTCGLVWAITHGVWVAA